MMHAGRARKPKLPSGWGRPKLTDGYGEAKKGTLLMCQQEDTGMERPVRHRKAWRTLITTVPVVQTCGGRKMLACRNIVC